MINSSEMAIASVVESFLGVPLIHLMAAVPSVGFAMLFSVPRKLLMYAGMGGVICFTTKKVLIDYSDMNQFMGYFIACSMVSLFFLWLCPKIKIPRQVFTVASIIPIIPGKFCFITLLSAIKIPHVEPNMRYYWIEQFFENGILSSELVFAMVLGIVLPPMFFYRNRPVV